MQTAVLYRFWRYGLLALLLVTLAVMAGCTSFGGAGGSQDGPAADGFEYDTREGGADSFGYADQDGGFGGQPLAGGGAIGPAEQIGRIIYFDYDSASIRTASRPVIEAHARYLMDNPQVGVLLEGHTDERGTREYNIALGERRGQAVRQALIGLGVGPQQLSVVSYGEERPQSPGQDENSYARNRRVEVSY